MLVEISALVVDDGVAVVELVDAATASEVVATVLGSSGTFEMTVCATRAAEDVPSTLESPIAVDDSGSADGRARRDVVVGSTSSCGARLTRPRALPLVPAASSGPTASWPCTRTAVGSTGEVEAEA